MSELRKIMPDAAKGGETESGLMGFAALSPSYGALRYCAAGWGAAMCGPRPNNFSR